MVTVHMVCSLLSYVAFLSAFVCGILFLIQERQLKRKRMGWLFHSLPSLGTLDRVNFMAIGAGFGLLSMGMVFGFLGVRAMFGTWWTHDPKVYCSLVLWVSYMLLWLVRVRATLRGRRVALLSVLGFSFLLFTFIGSTWLLPSWHAYL